MNTCSCGCGFELREGLRWVRGHSHRGTKHDARWRSNQSAGLRRALAEGKMPHIKNPTPEMIEKRAARSRGRKMSEEQKRAISARIKDLCAKGIYSKPETAEKRRQNIMRRFASGELRGRSAEEMAAVAAKRNMPALKALNSERMRKQIEEWKASGKFQQTCDKRRRALLGGHGMGKSQRGSMTHPSGKAWKIRSSCGEVFEFFNLREWVRQNIHRFHDYNPGSRMPFWLRVASGIKNMTHPKRDKACTHYQGWTVVSKSEGNDLLGRNEAEVLL